MPTYPESLPFSSTCGRPYLDVAWLYCHSCSLKHNEFQGQPGGFDAWYKGHKEDCSVNYAGSSSATEVEAAKRLWSQSLSLGLAYTGLVGDGDSKVY